MRGNTPRVHIIRRGIKKGIIFVLLLVRQKTFITNVLLQSHLKPPLFTALTIFHLLSLQLLVEELVIEPIDRVDERRLRRWRRFRSRRRSKIGTVIGGRRSNTTTPIVPTLPITSALLSECMSRPLRKIWIVPP
jgi:hypothetical protein